MCYKNILVIAGNILFISFSAFSDTLYLKNGRSIRGIIKEKGDYYIVTLTCGKVTSHKDEVAKVQYSSEQEIQEIKKSWAQQKSSVPSQTTQPSHSSQPTIIKNHMEISTPGEQIDITEYILKGKITVFDFFSPYCGPCRLIVPKLEKLAKKRTDIVVRKININCPSVHGIDWASPVAKQYNIHYVPYFKIYNKDGKLWLEDKEASRKIYTWLSQ